MHTSPVASAVKSYFDTHPEFHRYVSMNRSQGRGLTAVPLACPPGNFWIVGNEIGELKELAGRTIVPMESSSVIFTCQVPCSWRDELSLSTARELIRDMAMRRLWSVSRPKPERGSQPA